jgi:hypothetical protein
LLVYLAGMLAAGAAGGARLAALARFGRRCGPLSFPLLVKLGARAAEDVGLRRQPVLLTPEAPEPFVPMTWGWPRATVALPRKSERWPEPQLRAVLLHEYAHVARADWLTQCLASAACAVYWFHPLVWWLAHRQRLESEYACDDRVLAAGLPAPEYAVSLLEVIRMLNAPGLSLRGAVSMAHETRLEHRLRAILDERRRRGAVSPAVLALTALAGLAVAVPLAAMRPTAARPHTRPASPRPAPAPVISAAAKPGGPSREPADEARRTAHAKSRLDAGADTLPHPMLTGAASAAPHTAPRVAPADAAPGRSETPSAPSAGLATGAALMLDQQADIRNEKVELEARVERLNRDLARIDREAERPNADTILRERLEQQLADAEAKLLEAETQFLDINPQVQREKQRRDALVARLKQQSERDRAREAEYRKREEQLRAELTALRKRLAEREARLAALEAAFAERQARLGVRPGRGADLRSEALERLEREDRRITLEGELRSLMVELKAQEEELAEAEARVQAGVATTGEARRARVRLEQLRVQIQTVERRLAALR